MAHVIAIHSFRGGTGKSNTTANVAAVMARRGLRVGVIDTDIQSPGIHILFGLAGETIEHSLNDYLWERCGIEETAHEVTAVVGPPETVSGSLYLIPASIRPGEIARVLRSGYNVNLLSDGIRQAIQTLDLDVLLIDTHPGLNEETLLSIALAHTLLVVMRPDEQDYEGTGVTIRVARRLGVERLLVVVNKTPSAFNPAQVKAQVAETYECEVAVVLPHADELMTLASRDLFVTQYPHHPLSVLYEQLTSALLS